ncbi:hypothetical protein NIES3275_14350 [Microchaete diplosiphon NIES-3275]|nr:hypothetical protein NIES3275_14350 [Microchaete diplosiphon NIES-3275]
MGTAMLYPDKCIDMSSEFIGITVKSEIQNFDEFN